MVTIKEAIEARKKKKGSSTSSNEELVKKAMEKAFEFPQLQARQPVYDFPEFKPPQFAINAEQGIASEFHKRIAEMIQEFDASLDEEHEVGVRLVNFGQTIVFHLKDMGYYNPFLITFSGTTEEGNPVSLIQHVNQISIMLMKLPRKNPEEPKKPIGFASEHED